MSAAGVPIGCTDLNCYKRTVLLETWRIILARMQPGVIKFVQDAWYIRRAVLTGRRADGGNPMALPPVP
jgi:hypothetical protein